MKWGQRWGLPWGAGQGNQPGSVVRGRNVVWIQTPQQWDTDALEPQNWTITGGPADVVVGDVTYGEDTHELVLTTDLPLVEGVIYTLTALVNTLGGSPAGPWTVVGKRLSLPEIGDDQRDLLDIAARAFEAYRITPGGDHALEGGLETIRKVAYAIVTTEAQSLYYAPAFGVDIGHKKLVRASTSDISERLRRALTAIPRVATAEVTVAKSGNQIVIEFDIRTRLGPVSGSVTGA